MKSNQKGFSVVEAVLLLVIVAAVGFVGFYVWHSKPTAKPETNSVTTKKANSYGELKSSAGYVYYKNDKLSFSMAYPKTWGKMAGPTNDVDRYWTALTPEIDNKTKTIPIGNSWLSGFLSFSIKSASAFKINDQKYGATISPVKSGSGYAWKVVEVNPADPTDKVGDNYPVNKIQTPAGLTIYDFSYQDEGATTSRLVFVVNSQFVEVHLPYIFRFEQPEVSAQDMALYNSIAKSIQDSIKLNP